MSQFNYPKTEMGNLLRNGFAKRKRSETLAGDKKLASNDPLDSYKALSDGNYKGLEGIQYGTAGGLPAAMMPDGHVVLISEGEMIAGVQQREKRRRQMVETMAGDIDRREFGKKYQANFDNALASTELDESTAGLLRARYEADPGSAITFLTNYKIDDQREVERMKRDLAKQKQDSIDKMRATRGDGFSKQLLAASTGTPTEIALRQNAGVVVGGHVRRLAGVGADATSHYLQDDASLTELGTITSSLNYGVLRKAQEQFAGFTGSRDEFTQTPEFAELQTTLSNISSSMGVNFDPSTVGLALVARDGQHPDVMASPFMQTLRMEAGATQSAKITDPGPSDDMKDLIQRRRNGESISKAEERRIVIADQRSRLIAIANDFARERPGQSIPRGPFGEVQVLLEAALMPPPKGNEERQFLRGIFKTDATVRSMATKILRSVGADGELDLDKGLKSPMRDTTPAQDDLMDTFSDLQNQMREAGLIK